MRRLTILLTLAGCTSSSDSGGDDGSPSGRVDARAAPQTFECSGRRTETVAYSNGTMAEYIFFFAPIGRLDPADAPAVDAWVCDFTCGHCGGCTDGATCSATGDPVRPEDDGWCQATQAVIRPNGDAFVPCGYEYRTNGVASQSLHGARAYVRM